jgi:transposase-like protein
MSENRDFVQRIVTWLEDNHIFSRERKSNEQRALGMFLYYAGLSYEKAGSFVHASHEAVREWYQKGRELFEGSTEKKKRKWIAVDEKEIKLNGTTMFIWGAVDLDDEKVIVVWISFGRSGLEAMAFLKKIKHACKGKLPRIFIDGGSWYPWALERAGFDRYTVVSFGPRSAIERLFADIKSELGSFGTVSSESTQEKVWSSGWRHLLDSEIRRKIQKES